MIETVNSWGIIIILTLALTPISCLDSIEIELPDFRESSRLVIQGVIERSDRYYRFLVRVSETRDLNNYNIDEEKIAEISLIYNDQAILSLQNGSEFLVPVQLFHQLYGDSPEKSVFNIRIQVGQSTFESIPQSILHAPEGANLKLVYEEREELNEIENVVTRPYVKLLASAPIISQKGEKVSYLWNVSGVFLFREIIWTLDTSYDPRLCYVSDPPSQNEIKVINSDNINVDTIKNFEIHQTSADYRFASGYYYTVVQKTIDAKAADYWQQLSASINREGTIYDPPVGIVTTNITQIGGDPVEVLGYFYTAGIDTLRILSTRDETGNQPHMCIHRVVSEVCCDCILILNSSYDKPAYWD